MQKKNLLILGGNELNVLAIIEAKNCGFKTYVVDKNPNSPGFKVADVFIVEDIINPQAIYEQIKNIGINGIVSMAEVGIKTKAWLDNKLNLDGGLSIEAAENVTSKVAMRKKWTDIPEYSVPYVVVETIEDAKKAVNLLNYFPLIVKPDKTFGGSRGVSKVFFAEKIIDAFDFARNASFNKKVVIEKCATGNEYSCEVLVYKKKTSVLAIGLKVKSEEPYRVDYSVQYPAVLDENQIKDIEDMCHRAILLLGIENGVAHIEFAYTTDGPKLFEIGARCGGGHTPLITKHVSGVNEFIEYCNISCGLPPTDFFPKHQKGAEYRFLIFPEGVVSRILFSDEIKKNPAILDLVLSLKEKDIIKPIMTTADRLGCLVTTGNTLKEAVDEANLVCSQLKIQYQDDSIKNALTIFI